jgi:hypothetical protein
MQCTHELISKAAKALYDRDLDSGDTLNLPMWQHLFECLLYLGVEDIQPHVVDLNVRTSQTIAAMNKVRAIDDHIAAVSLVELQSHGQWIHMLKFLRDIPGNDQALKQIIEGSIVDFDKLEAAIEFDTSSAEMRAQLLELIK